jgi:hypothetical protein
VLAASEPVLIGANLRDDQLVSTQWAMACEKLLHLLTAESGTTRKSLALQRFRPE